MENFARVINNIAVDVSTDPASQFHPDIASQFEPVPENVTRGWQRIDSSWTAPTPTEPIPLPIQYATVSPVEFMLLFTSPERVAIKAARQTNAVVEDFFQLLEDPRLQTVRLGQASVQEGLAYLVSVNLLTDQRRTEILQTDAI